MRFLFFNGEYIPAEARIFSAQNRGFRYGDGVFETIKVLNGEILHLDLHLERLFTSLKLLNLNLPPTFSKPFVLFHIIELCKKNEVLALARIRIAVYRTENNEAGYVIEAMPLPQDVNTLNEKGWSIDIYPLARKSCDAFAALKTANYLPYAMADMYAAENNLEECLVLNTLNAIADASKANIFLIKGETIYTPALHQGCVNGVMRRYVIEELKKLNFAVHQTKIMETDLLQSDEVFLTNAINNIRWVQRFREKTYTNSRVKQIYRQVFL